MNITDICNLALSYLGKGPIDSLDEDSENARSIKVQYDIKRQMLLKGFTWGFAEKTTKLAQMADIEIAGWKYIYAYPADCLAVRRIYAAERGERKELSNDKWFVQLTAKNIKVICTNTDNACMDYTADSKIVELFSPEFCDALAHYIASGAAQSLLGSDAKMQTELQMGQYLAAQATYNAAMEREQKPQFPSKYFDGRF